MDSIHAALSTCPNMTALDLRLSTSGCTGEGPDRWNFPLRSEGGDRYANLTSLRLERYDFDDEFGAADRQPGIEECMSDTLCVVKSGLQQQILSPAKTHLDLWMEAMDWSAISELMITPITDEHMAKLPSRLHSLRRLETTNSSFIYALPNNTLTHLTYIEASKSGYAAKDLPTILAHQGASLQSLEVRSPELEDRPFVCDFDVAILPRMAQNLEHVALNVARNGTWPLDTLNVLSSLPQLCSADLYMGIQSACTQQRPLREVVLIEDWKPVSAEEYCRGANQYQQPFVSKEGAEEVFAHMRKEKKGVELANLTIYVGDWSRPWNGGLYIPDWLEGKRSKVVCIAEDGMEKCVAERAERYWEWDEHDWMNEWRQQWDLEEEKLDLEEERWELEEKKWEGVKTNAGEARWWSWWGQGWWIDTLWE
jgi:hypothetical protein